MEEHENRRSRSASKTTDRYYGPVYGLEEPSSAVGRRPVPILVDSRFPCMCYRDTTSRLLLNVGPVRLGADSPNRERDSFPNLAALPLG